jgi:carbon monoxide dehydrogenase subunit G
VKLTGERFIARDQQAVWEALNDPYTLQKSIKGCESLVQTGPNEFQIVMMVVVGPVRANFKAKLSMSDVQPPTSYVLTFAGSGGSAGFGNGTARVYLEPEGLGTSIRYEASAQVGGRLAQVGSRLMQGVAEILSAQFFASFVDQVEAQGVAPATASGLAAGTGPAAARPDWYRRPRTWIAFGAAAAGLLLWSWQR